MKVYLKPEKKRRECVQFADSLALVKKSLQEVTSSWKVKHAKLDVHEGEEKDFELVYRQYMRGDELPHKYLYYDCVGLYEVVELMRSEIDKLGGRLGLTLPSTALNVYRTKFLDTNLTMLPEDISNEFRNAFYGGRTEIFRMRLEEGKYYCFDVNSLYPSVMRDGLFPVSTPIITTSPSPKIYQQEEGITVARVIAPKDLYLPLLPVRVKTKQSPNGKLFFPVGTFEGYWDNYLLRKAKAIGYKVIPKKSFSFRCEAIFKDWVDKMWAFRIKSSRDDPFYDITKMLMNSLYGKTAQKRESSILYMLKKGETEDDYEDTLLNILDDDHGVIELKSKAKGRHFIPHIASHVTALAQLRLYDYMEEIIEHGGVLAYCDTDSVFTDHKLPTNDKKLGAMKLEYDFHRAYFIRPKTYWTDNGNVPKAKGYFKEFREGLNEDSFKKALLNGDYSDFAMNVADKLSTPKRSFASTGRWTATLPVRKRIISEYDKREVLSDYDTRPFLYKDLA